MRDHLPSWLAPQGQVVAGWRKQYPAGLNEIALARLDHIERRERVQRLRI